MSKYIDLIGWDDCPHLRPPFVTEQQLADMERDYLPHQRKARRTGRPGLGAGAIYPVDLDAMLCPPFKIPDHFQRAYALDVGWNRTAALLGARDPDTDTYYLTHEYYRAHELPVVHTHGIKAMLPWPKCPGAADPASRGGSQRDGEKLLMEYQDLGLNLFVAENAVEAGIMRVLVLMQSGQLRIWNSLRYFQKEFQLYRRDEKGKIVKKNDHLMDDMRYLLNTPGLFTTQPVQQARNRGRGEW